MTKRRFTPWIALVCIGTLAACTSSDDGTAGNTELNVIVPTNAGTPNTVYVQDISVKDQFDDILIWVSRNTLLNQMISAGKWP